MLLQPTSALCVLDDRYVELFSLLLGKKIGHWNTVLGLAHKLNPFFSEKKNLLDFLASCSKYPARYKRDPVVFFGWNTRQPVSRVQHKNFGPLVKPDECHRF